MEGATSYVAMLAAAHDLRVQREREKELINQRQDEESDLSHRDQRLQRLQQQLKDLRQASVGASPQGKCAVKIPCTKSVSGNIEKFFFIFLGLLQRLEEETSVNTYIARQKLPREIEAREQEVAIMSAVLAEPAMGRSDLDDLNSKVRAYDLQLCQNAKNM